MSQKKPASKRLANTLNELDSALEQWDSLTNKPQGEQGQEASEPQKKAKNLLNELRQQINEFESLTASGDSDK